MLIEVHTSILDKDIVLINPDSIERVKPIAYDDLHSEIIFNVHGHAIKVKESPKQIRSLIWSNQMEIYRCKAQEYHNVAEEH